MIISKVLQRCSLARPSATEPVIPTNYLDLETILGYRDHHNVQETNDDLQTSETLLICSLNGITRPLQTLPFVRIYTENMWVLCTRFLAFIS